MFVHSGTCWLDYSVSLLPCIHSVLINGFSWPRVLYLLARPIIAVALPIPYYGSWHSFTIFKYDQFSGQGLSCCLAYLSFLLTNESHSEGLFEARTVDHWNWRTQNILWYAISRPFLNYLPQLRFESLSQIHQFIQLNILLACN